MSLPPNDLAWIEDRVTHAPELQDRLLACAGPGEAAALLARLAREQGRELDEAALSAHFAQQAASAQLDDEALERVSGGVVRVPPSWS